MAVPKLANGVIRGACCLESFVPGDANANVSGLNHGNIVGSIANCQGGALQVLLDKGDHVGLLNG